MHLNDYMKITEITRKMNLKYLLESFSSEIIPILRNKLLIVPEVQNLNGKIKIPITFDYKCNQTKYAFTNIPLYTKYC